MLQLCHIDDCIENYCKGFSIQHQNKRVDLFVVSQNKRVHVYLNQCPHTGSTLDWDNDKFLNLENDYIQCAQHGALFDIDTGECIYGPCLGQSLTTVPHFICKSWTCVQLEENNPFPTSKNQP